MKYIFLFPTINEMRSVSKNRKNGIVYHNEHFSYLTCGMKREGLRYVSLCKESSLVPIIIGYGGALTSELQTGDVVISHTFLSQNGICEVSFSKEIDAWGCTIANNGISVYVKPCYTSNEIISQQEIKDSLYKKGAWVVDMEGYWLAQKFSEYSIPCFSIRVILDDYRRQLPDLTGTMKINGQISLANLTWHLLKYPHHIYSLLEIFSLTKKAKPVMKKCCYLVSGYLENLHI